MPKSLRYALMVFLGGASYGAMLPFIRISYGLGFTPTSGMLVQNILSFVILIALAAMFFRSKMSLKQLAALMVLGAVSYVMSFTYFLAMQYISATVCITLMFQYIWMGIIIHAVVDRRLPRPLTVVACVVVMLGTVLTTGILEEDVRLNLIGVSLALLSALAYAMFLFLSGRIATELPVLWRLAIMSAARLLLAAAAAPLFAFALPPILPLLGMGLLLALGGIIVPVLLIQSAAPHLPASVTMIMSASELPCAVILAALLIGEVLHALAIIGIILILAGIVLSQAPELVELVRRLKRHRAQA